MKNTSKLAVVCLHDLHVRLCAVREA